MCPAIHPCFSDWNSACQKNQKSAAPADVAARFDQLAHLRDMKARHGQDADFVRRQAWV